MTQVNILRALLALMLASGMIQALYAAQHVQMPLWWMVLSSFLLNFLPYYWYRLDSERRRFLPPGWMSSAVVALAPLGIPVYLLRSRAPGERLRALAQLGLFLVQMLAAAVVGVLSFFVMPG